MRPYMESLVWSTCSALAVKKDSHILSFTSGFNLSMSLEQLGALRERERSIDSRIVVVSNPPSAVIAGNGILHRPHAIAGISCCARRLSSHD